MEKTHAGNINPNIRQIVVEIEVADVQNKEFTFVPNKELDKAARIVAIESFHASQVPYTPFGKALITQAFHNKTYLQLNDSSGTTLRTIPLLHLTVDAPKTRIEPLNIKGFDLQQSKVVISEATGQTAGQRYMFLVTYEKSTKAEA